MFYTYILTLNNGEYYTGFTTDLKQRVQYHNNGLVETTKTNGPVKLVFYGAFTTQKLATNFEKYLKSSSGFAFRNKHLV